MGNPAFLVSQSGQLTNGLQAIMSTQGYDLTTIVIDSTEDSVHYLSSTAIARIEQHVSDAAESYLTVIDGAMHPGQFVDLQLRLPLATLRDRRGVIWEWLGKENPVAATQFDLQQCRITQRKAAMEQRGDATSGPSGTSGELTAAEQQVQQLRSTLESRQAMARQRIQSSYTDVDSQIVLVGRMDAPTTTVWAGLTDQTVSSIPGRPAQPTTAITTCGPHTLAVTDTPGIPDSDNLPEWFSETVPGMMATIERATCVLGVGDCQSLLSVLDDQYDLTCRILTSADAPTARETLQDVLETAEYVVQLPYSDTAHTLVSKLHEQTTVHAIEYDDAIYVRTEVALSAADWLRRQTLAVDGDIQADPTGT
ncbi:MAG: hypothetical protein J07HQX50_01476 [Haloquadratum sp. J07HQX50]|jgi:hypothetical protein|nr:MAG: hypothetical protein J07HQX50_01476 [Haloquadratum sp. J07HQX50]